VIAATVPHQAARAAQAGRGRVWCPVALRALAHGNTDRPLWVKTCHEHSLLSAERGEPRAGGFRHSFVFCIGNEPEETLDAVAPHWRDNPELCKMRAARIDHCSRCSSAAQVSWSQRTACRPGDRFADDLGVCGIALVSLHVWLHIGRRHQAHCVSKRSCGS
jgi:hypothetical protein